MTKLRILYALIIIMAFAKSATCQNTEISCPLSVPDILNQADKPGWTLVFQDEFTDAGLDVQKWNNHGGSWGNEYYYQMPQNIVQSGDGTLKIYTKYQPGTYQENGELVSETRDYTVGNISTYTHFGPGHYYEIRCKLPKGQLFHTGFYTWIMDCNKNIPWSEVDFYENGFCDDIHLKVVGMNHHKNIGSSCGGNTSTEKKITDDEAKIPISWTKPNLHDSFYTVGCYWRADKIIWYVNNIWVRTMTTNVPRLPGFLILGNGLSVTEKITTDASAKLLNMRNTGCFDNLTNNAFIIDYVRVYDNDTEGGDISPNPNDGNFKVTFKDYKNFNEMSMTDFSGIQVLPTTKISNEIMLINISHLPKGIYILNIINAFGRVIHKKVVKQ